MTILRADDVEGLSHQDHSMMFKGHVSHYTTGRVESAVKLAKGKVQKCVSSI